MPPNPGALKRAKERARQEKQEQKRQDKQKKKDERAKQGPTVEGGEDPDLAGIVPGPQPPLEGY
ncbi:MAG TPA: hypothetical protein VEY30_06140 [Myxococcaceae bacterium]|nr:hypothetical protein [Myxococcaceae bacterium]